MWKENGKASVMQVQLQRSAPTIKAPFVDLNLSVTRHNFKHLYAGRYFFFNKKDKPLPLIPSAPVELLSSSVIQLPGGRSVCDRVNVKQGDAETKQQSWCAHGSVDPSGIDKSNAANPALPGPPHPQKKKD